jgi:hypothetical protein
MRVLVDTSVWVDFFNGHPSRQAEPLTHLIREKADWSHAVTPAERLVALAFPLFEVPDVLSSVTKHVWASLLTEAKVSNAMRQRRVSGLGVFLVMFTFLSAVTMEAALTQRCQWGIWPHIPTVSPTSTQVIMMPIVLNFGGLPMGVSKVAFVSYQNATQANIDGGGVLRIIDHNCNEIAQFPSSFTGPIPPGCPANIYSHHVAPVSGLAAGNIDANPDVEIIAVLDATTANHAQIVALNLSNGILKPKWCSQPLPTGDFIGPSSAPAIARLDQAPGWQRQIILDNKVFDFNGTLRYTGFNHGGNNCATSAGSPCPRSHTTLVSNVLGQPLPQVITGRGLYQSTNPATWTGTLAWWNAVVTNLAPGLTFPAVAELDPSSLGPEIVVTDTMVTTLRVLSAAGVQLASAPIPNPGFSKCGGPPLIGNFDGGSDTEIGVASCSRYSVFKYSSGTLSSPLWSMPTFDPGGQTSATLINTPTGARVYYTDAQKVWVFDGATGGVLQSIPNSSATAIEGPTVAAFDNGTGRGSVIVAANGTYHGVRIFDDPTIGPMRAFMNQHTYHVTNISNFVGSIPAVEPPSWVAPARNTYRAQQWP